MVKVAYLGQEFIISWTWDAGSLTCRSGLPPDCGDFVRWLLYRETKEALKTGRTVVLWRPADSFGGE